MSREIKVLLFRGTGAPLKGDGILGSYAEKLGDWADVQWVDYPASYGNPSYDISVEQGIRMGLRAIREAGKPVIVGGFSQGADVAGTLHALLNGSIPNKQNHDLTGCHVEASFTIADPSRSTNARVLNGPVGGWGIRGQRTIGAGAYTVANPGDPICAYPNGPLRSFADFSAYFGDPERVDKIRNMVDEKRLQPWWKQPNPADWVRNWLGSLGWLNNYFSGFHDRQYLDKGLVRQLADHTNKIVQENLLQHRRP